MGAHDIGMNSLVLGVAVEVVYPVLREVWTNDTFLSCCLYRYLSRHHRSSQRLSSMKNYCVIFLLALLTSMPMNNDSNLCATMIDAGSMMTMSIIMANFGFPPPLLFCG
jgi:hypothetical protein